MPLKVRKLKPNRIFQNVVAQIEEAILSGQIKPGDVLPSEMKLKEMFHTSRGTIREALRVLEEKGLVDVKTGVAGGAVVKALGTEKVAENLNMLIQTRSLGYDQLAEFRELVETAVADMAARRATPEDVARLEEIASAARDCQDPLDVLRADIALHVTLAKITGNPLFTIVVRMIHDTVMGNFERYTMPLDQDKDNFQENIEDMEKIIRAVAEGDGERASSLAREHVRKFNAVMKTLE